MLNACPAGARLTACRGARSKVPGAHHSLTSIVLRTVHGEPPTLEAYTENSPHKYSDQVRHAAAHAQPTQWLGLQWAVLFAMYTPLCSADHLCEVLLLQSAARREYNKGVQAADGCLHDGRRAHWGLPDLY